MGDEGIRRSQLTGLLFEVNHAIDAGKSNLVTFERVRKAALRGELLRYLADSVGDELDITIAGGETDWIRIDRAIAQLAGGIEGRERKKAMVENNGLCLAIAYILDLVQVVCRGELSILLEE